MRTRLTLLGGLLLLPSLVSAPAAQQFVSVDLLDHESTFFPSLQVGDADHDGRQEFVLLHEPVPASSGPRRVVFYEDDGTGQFDEVFSVPSPTGSVYAIGDVDQDGLTDLFLNRSFGICNKEFFRLESSSPSGFPDHEVWQADQQGNVVNWPGRIADADGDGALEFITTDNSTGASGGCFSTTLKIFESAAGNQMSLILNLPLPLGVSVGNPVVTDLDGNGRQEIAMAVFEGEILLLESTADDVFEMREPIVHDLYNAFELEVVQLAADHPYRAIQPLSWGPPSEQVPLTCGLSDERPLLFLAGQRDGEYRVLVFQALQGCYLQLVNDVFVSACALSIPSMCAADVAGDPVPEILLAVCERVPIFSVKRHGAMTLLDEPLVPESFEVTAISQGPRRSASIAVGTFSSASNPGGKTVVLGNP